MASTVAAAADAPAADHLFTLEDGTVIDYNREPDTAALCDDTTNPADPRDNYRKITWDQLKHIFCYERTAHGFKISGDISQKFTQYWDRSKQIKVRDHEGLGEGAIFFYDEDSPEPYFSWEDVEVGNHMEIRSPRLHKFMDGQEGIRLEEHKSILRVTKQERLGDDKRFEIGMLNKNSGNASFKRALVAEAREQKEDEEGLANNPHYKKKKVSAHMPDSSARHYETAMNSYEAAIGHLEGAFRNFTPERQQEAKEALASCCLNIGACQIATKNWAAVEGPCEKALRINATTSLNAKAYFRMGHALLELGHTCLAEEKLRRADQLVPNDGKIAELLQRIAVIRYEEKLADQKLFQLRQRRKAERLEREIAQAANPGAAITAASDTTTNTTSPSTYVTAGSNMNPNFGVKPNLFGPPPSALASVPNFRDLGGLPCNDGRTVTKSFLLYRSSNLYDATTGASGETSNDLQILTRDLGIKTIIDMRNPLEVEELAKTAKKQREERYAALVSKARRMEGKGILAEGVGEMILEEMAAKRSKAERAVARAQRRKDKAIIRQKKRVLREINNRAEESSTASSGNDASSASASSEDENDNNNNKNNNSNSQKKEKKSKGKKILIDYDAKNDKDVSQLTLVELNHLRDVLRKESFAAKALEKKQEKKQLQSSNNDEKRNASGEMSMTDYLIQQHGTITPFIDYQKSFTIIKMICDAKKQRRSPPSDGHIMTPEDLAAAGSPPCSPTGTSSPILDFPTSSSPGAAAAGAGKGRRGGGGVSFHRRVLGWFMWLSGGDTRPSPILDQHAVHENRRWFTILAREEDAKNNKKNKAVFPNAAAEVDDVFRNRRVILKIDLATRTFLAVTSYWTLVLLALCALIRRVDLASKMMVQRVIQPLGPRGVLQKMIEFHGPEIAQIFVIACDEANYPLVITCTMGKDRTGIIVALLLAAADVKFDAILDDYAAKTNAALQKMPDLVRYQREMGLPDDVWAVMDPAVLRGTFVYIQKTYGGIIRYLETIGITRVQVQQLRRIITKPI